MDSKERYEELKSRLSFSGDVERLPLIYICSENEELYSKINKIYNFEKNEIIPHCLGFTEDEKMENLWVNREIRIRCDYCGKPIKDEEFKYCDPDDGTYTCVSCVEEITDFSGSGRALVKLGFSLYSGSGFDESYNVPDLFSNLDRENFNIGIRAIQIRYGYVDKKSVTEQEIYEYISERYNVLSENKIAMGYLKTFLKDDLKEFRVIYEKIAIEEEEENNSLPY